MYGFTDRVLGVVLCFIMIVLMLVSVMVSGQLQARHSIVAEVANFIDEVADTAVLDEKHVANLCLAYPACGPFVDVQILRYAKVVNPDPRSPGDTYMVCVGSNDIHHWNQGDLLKVKVTEVGPTGLASFLYSVFGLNMVPVDFMLARRIRS